MRWLLTSIMILVGCTVQGQEWCPYIPGQVSYYYTEGQNTYASHNFYDTGISIRALQKVAYRQNHTTYFFLYGDATDSVNYLFACSSVSLPDSMTYSKGVYTYWFPDLRSTYPSDSMRFYFDDSVGTKWTTQDPFGCNLNFEVVDIGLDTFLGFIDSVKTFNISSSCQSLGEFLISKNYGFIRGYLPFPGFYSLYLSLFEPTDNLSYQEIIGFENDTLSSGVHVPSVVDFVPYTQGTILKWRFWKDRGYHDTKNAILRDSVTEISLDADYARIRVIRTVEGDYYSKIDTVYQTMFSIYLSALRAALQVHSNYYFIQAFPVTNGFNYFAFETKIPFLVRNTRFGGYDYTSTFWTTGGGLEVSGFKDSCFIRLDVGFEHEVLKYNTRYGLLRYRWEEVNPPIGYHDDLELIGYKSDVDSFGDVSKLVIGVDDISSHLFSIYPNPASSSYTLDLPEHILQQGLLQIQDLNGRKVLQKSLHGKATWPVDHLQPGLYVVTVTTESQRYQAKLMVQ